jgi:hypothetical protein
MSVTVKRKKIVKECDGGAPCAPYSSAATNIGGMGNPVPPSATSPGSGDAWGATKKMSTQAGSVTENKHKKYKLKRKK